MAALPAATPVTPSYQQKPDSQPSIVAEQDIESAFIGKLCDLKYTHRPDIRDRASLEANFRQKFEALNRVRLTDAEFARLLDDLVSPDVFKNSVRLREKNDFTRDDGTPLSYTLVNIKDWCKNDFEVVHQLRINTDYSHHRYDVILLINGVPVVQVELKTLGVNPRRAMEQIVDNKADPGNGYTRDTIVDQIDFEFVLFASADIDYDYIMTLCARFTSQTPGREKMSREKLIGIIEADAKFMDERETITDYVRTLQAGQGLNQKEIEAGYRRFRDERHAVALAAVAQKHALATERLQAFVDTILQRMVFDGEQLTVLLEPLDLNWKARRVAELALMEDLVPLLKKRAAGREISGLNAYES